MTCVSALTCVGYLSTLAQDPSGSTLLPKKMASFSHKPNSKIIPPHAYLGTPNSRHQASSIQHVRSHHVDGICPTTIDSLDVPYQLLSLYVDLVGLSNRLLRANLRFGLHNMLINRVISALKPSLRLLIELRIFFFSGIEDPH